MNIDLDLDLEIFFRFRLSSSRVEKLNKFQSAKSRTRFELWFVKFQTRVLFSDRNFPPESPDRFAVRGLLGKNLVQLFSSLRGRKISDVRFFDGASVRFFDACVDGSSVLKFYDVNLVCVMELRIFEFQSVLDIRRDVK